MHSALSQTGGGNATFFSTDFLSLSVLDSGKRKKKGTETEQIDCTPPEHILPGSKERPLCALQPQNRDWKVEFSCVILTAFGTFLQQTGIQRLETALKWTLGFALLDT